MRPGRRVLVTGGSGFIGSSVVRALARAGQVEHVVSGDVRTLDGLPGDVVQEHVDVTDDPSVSRVIRDHQIDTVVHLAAIVNPGPSMPRDVIHRVDVEGTHRP